MGSARSLGLEPPSSGAPLMLFLTAFTIDFFHFEVHCSCSVRVLRRDSISAHNWYGLRTYLPYSFSTTVFFSHTPTPIPTPTQSSTPILTPSPTPIASMRIRENAYSQHVSTVKFTHTRYLYFEWRNQERQYTPPSPIAVPVWHLSQYFYLLSE